MEQGFCYFDTAFPYHNEKSEAAVKRCLVDRYDREEYLLADKMPVWFIKKYADFQKYFDMQLERCGVTYFDYYLLHGSPLLLLYHYFKAMSTLFPQKIEK